MTDSEAMQKLNENVKKAILYETKQKLKLMQVCNDRFDINLLKTNEYQQQFKKFKTKITNKVNSLD